MQQVNQNEQVGAGMIVTADKEGRLKSATTYQFHFNQLATKEECFNLATRLNADEEVTEEDEAIELLCVELRDMEIDMDDGEINKEQFEDVWEVFHWMISSLLGSPYWCVVFRPIADTKVVGLKYEKLTAEEFATRVQDIQDRLELIAD